MTFGQAFATSEMSHFLHTVLHRLKALAAESGADQVVMPVGIFLLIDKANGGDATAEELAARFVEVAKDLATERPVEPGARWPSSRSASPFGPAM